MSRPKRGTAGRQSRNWGYISGTTLRTIDSGVTIDQNGVVLAANIGIAAGSGVTLDSAGIKGSDGSSYLLGGLKGVDTNSVTGGGILISAGVTHVVAAGKIFAAATFGMTTLDVVIASGSTPLAGVTNIAICVTRGGGKAWNSNATQCMFHPYASFAGVATAVGASVHYLVIGQ